MRPEIIEAARDRAADDAGADGQAVFAHLGFVFLRARGSGRGGGCGGRAFGEETQMPLADRGGRVAV
jgi:hypothetical protein